MTWVYHKLIDSHVIQIKLFLYFWPFFTQQAMWSVRKINCSKKNRMVSIAFLFKIFQQGKPLYSRMKGSDCVYNSNTLNLKLRKLGTTHFYMWNYWWSPVSCGLGQDVAVALPAHVFRMQSVPRLSHVWSFWPLYVCALQSYTQSVGSEILV